MQGHSDPNRELLDARALCRQLVRDGSVEAFLADHRHELFPDEMFEDLFPSGRGRPSVPADVVASVMVLQALEGLSDRDAARALKDRISWKVACGLALDDEGFDYSVLAYWRARLKNSERPERIFEAVRAVVDATGVLKGKARRALDSTLLDDAVATQDTVTQLSPPSAGRRVVPGAAEVPVSAHDYDPAGKPVIAWDDPVAKAALVDGLVKDALAIIAAFPEPPAEPEAAKRARVVGPCGRPRCRTGRRRHLEGWLKKVAPDRVISWSTPKPVTCTSPGPSTATATRPTSRSSPRPGILTAVALTPANAADAPVGVELLAGERPGLQVLADGAYGSGEALAALAKAGYRRAIKPHPLPIAVPGGFDRDDFVVDAKAGTATCPAGHTVSLTPGRAAVFGALCRGCPLRRALHQIGRGQGCCACTLMMPSWSSPAEPGETGTLPRNTGDGAPWWNAPSPGWWLAATGAAASGA